MTDKQKKLISDMRFTQASYAEIAAATGLSVNTIKTYCRRNKLSDTDLAEQTCCRNCGCLIPKGKFRPRIFCSDKCRMTWWNCHLGLVKRAANYALVCDHCGQPFTAYGNAKRKYCTRECYLASRRSEEAGQ